MDFSLMFWFSTQFFKKRWDHSEVTTLIILVFFSFCLYWVNFFHIPQVNTLAALFLTLVMNLLFFQGFVKGRILCSIAEVLLIVTCESIPISLFAALYHRNLTSVINVTIRNAAFNLIGTGLFSVIVLETQCFMLFKKQHENQNIGITQNYAITVVPFFSIVMIYYILDFTMADTWLTLTVLLGILLMNLVVIIGDSNLRKRYHLQRELDELTCKERLSRTVIEQQDRFIEELKGVAHDYAKQMDGFKIILSAVGSDHGLGGEFQTYADQMDRSIAHNYRFAFIPTYGLRSILSQAQLHCEAGNITFDTDIQFCDFSFISFPDLYSIFENPIDNAICACSAIPPGDLPPKIWLKILRKKNMIWVEIRNTKNNPIQVKNSLILTNKEDKKWHGLGIKNMKRALSRYDGYATLEYTDSEFFVTMAIPAPDISDRRNFLPHPQ